MFVYIRREKDRVALRGGQNWLDDVTSGTRRGLDMRLGLHISIFFLPFGGFVVFGFDFSFVKLFSRFLTRACWTHCEAVFGLASSASIESLNGPKERLD